MRPLFLSLFLHLCGLIGIAFAFAYAPVMYGLEEGRMRGGGKEGNALHISYVEIKDIPFSSSSSSSSEKDSIESFVEDIPHEKESAVIENPQEELAEIKAEVQETVEEKAIFQEKEEVEVLTQKSIQEPKIEQAKPVVESSPPKIEKVNPQKERLENKTKVEQSEPTRSQVGVGSSDTTGKGLENEIGEGSGELGSGSGEGSALGVLEGSKDTDSYLSKIVQLRKPTYPQRSRQAGEEGTVEIFVQVEQGRLKEATIYLSSGSQRLDNAALSAVKKAKFVAFSGSLIVPIIFKLD